MNTRQRTVSMRLLKVESRRESRIDPLASGAEERVRSLVAEAAEYERAVREERPKTRADCAGGCRPCPWVSCRWNLYLDVTTAGSIKFNFPGRELHDLEETCALDVADRGGSTLEATGKVLGLTRERIRQITEDEVLPKIRAALDNASAGEYTDGGSVVELPVHAEVPDDAED